jgi:hypothetical protein
LELQDAHVEQAKQMQKMKKQYSKVAMYQSTIAMQEKVIAKMQSVVENRLRNVSKTEEVSNVNDTGDDVAKKITMQEKIVAKMQWGVEKRLVNASKMAEEWNNNDTGDDVAKMEQSAKAEIAAKAEAAKKVVDDKKADRREREKEETSVAVGINAANIDRIHQLEAEVSPCVCVGPYYSFTSFYLAANIMLYMRSILYCLFVLVNG